MFVPRFIIAKKLPTTPGVYLFKNAAGKVIYVGKAVNLRVRVSSYFKKKPTGEYLRRIEEAIDEVAAIDHIKTGTAIEALILEANLIKKLWPAYNVLEKDDKSFLYTVITRKKFSRVELLRGAELERLDETAKKKKFLAVFGPYISAGSLRAALKLLRKIFPWSNCTAEQSRPCFYFHIKQCPGVCVGEAQPAAYQKNIRRLIKFMRGEKIFLLHDLRGEMNRVSRAQEFEAAARLRNQIWDLEHIQDIAVIGRDWNGQEFLRDANKHGKAPHKDWINIYGRIEAYDISNIGGFFAVGSMVVLNGGEPNKSEYRRYKIKTVQGSNDVAMMKEVLRRRFSGSRKGLMGTVLKGTLLNAKRLEVSPLELSPRRPDIILVDGGRPQVNAANGILKERGLKIPLLGIAKGPDRKKDDFIFASKEDIELERLTRLYPHIFKLARDEAHRFAIAYHRKLRGRIGK
ncbi:MAG: UvrABC system protein C [Candidatus Magasanikbacteria bacterium]|nr:UvrABC system protein C [Candidatus Magasanikbacteria bacterium]